MTAFIFAILLAFTPVAGLWAVSEEVCTTQTHPENASRTRETCRRVIAPGNTNGRWGVTHPPVP